MANTELLIEKTEFNGDAGIWDYHVRIVEKIDENHEVKGPIVVHSIDHDSLQLRHKGDLDHWLENHVVNFMKERYKGHKLDHAKATGHRGKRIAIQSS